MEDTLLLNADATSVSSANCSGELIERDAISSSSMCLLTLSALRCTSLSSIVGGLYLGIV